MPGRRESPMNAKLSACLIPVLVLAGTSLARADIDLEKLAYYGMSWGGKLGGVIPAVEDRIKTTILLAGGVHDVGLPEANPPGR